ncbi:MAG: uncharacterized protein PWR22_273 [Moorella sp. (in: firmicutes)]|jgi:hypothetical protein|uniref:DUF116 domain-containing protein n=1 Tax=unclassified Neomoorella TaxID=2676739 RepID=UPI0010FFBD12|nr:MULTISPECIES: DUF116 domain-containing protein [unclassified Moorella (in: firmicutes)]MDK2815645.1 uncharacterized protein [Moorella sp. (in: firmicutes)]MDK2894169.1 uncharacterized protein [Moorella sp. (in: firmicutes)]GEA15082.1 hypothetical protein E308F_13260 [Moorella sp. E308F]GEA17007.1 hypothetical protein E306M_01410 [Moorella sp. E306M]
MRIKKRLFIGLLALSLLFITAVLAGSWYLLVNHTSFLNRLLLVLGFFTLAVLFLIIALGIGGLVLILWQERSRPFLQRLGLIAVNTLFPVALALGRRLGVKAETIKASFIEMNNQLVRLQGLLIEPGKILLLAPHCLQWSGCPHKITVDVYNCRRCGRCPIDSLHALAERYGVRLAVATGGTLARHFVKQYRPRAVVAIACERDLTSGIQDTQPMPVLGVLNSRPHGPCLNTQVNLNQVEQAIQFFLYGKTISQPQVRSEGWGVGSSV